MKKTDLAYFAGLFDGEGSICITRHKPKRGISEQHTLLCLLSMTNREAVSAFRDCFGGGMTVHERSNGKRKLMWGWVMSSNKARIFLESILPFLRIKKAEAVIAIEFQTRKKQYNGKPVPIAEIEFRQNYREKLWAMKR